MTPRRRALLVPAAVALVIVLAYFLITQNWENLGNPVGSVVALAAGGIGAASGVWLDRRRRPRRPAEAAAVPAN